MPKEKSMTAVSGSSSREAGVARMKFTTISIMFLLAGIGSSRSEMLDKRYGPDFERGYRGDREYGGPTKGFKNRDRSNFLGVKKQNSIVPAFPAFPKKDLQSAPNLGTQR